MRARRILLTVALTMAALVTSACATTPPPASEKVQAYYESHKTGPAEPTATAKPVIAFIGDSYTQGTGASNTMNTWVQRVATAIGMSPANLGRGGTGYVAVSGMAGCGLDVCPNYGEMIAAAVAAKPSTVVVSGGQNDFIQFGQDPETVTAAIDKTFKNLRAALPDATILAVGPSTPWPISADVVAFDAAVRNAATTVRASYVSLIEPNVINKNFVTEDGAHVNDFGHTAIAERVLTALR